jgi:hypothetical protein
MAELLLLNPRGRRKAKRASPARKRRTSGKRRRNPIAVASHSPVRRHKSRTYRRARVASRRGTSGAVVQMLKDAAIGGAGAVAMDLGMGYVNAWLPDALKTQPNSVGAGDALKAALTVAAGVLLAKHTGGLSKKAALGALTTQVRDIISVNLPPSVALGFASPAKVIPGTARVGPSRMNAYQPGQAAGGTKSPLLSAYQGGGSSPLLSNSSRIMSREGVRYR